MMLYIFHVDAGRTMTFEMELRMDTVYHIKEMIQRNTKIPASSQVLLASGGVVLLDNERVCKYSAGTDSNPIFMYSTLTCNAVDDYCPEFTADDLDCLHLEVFRTSTLEVNYNTVSIRCELAQKFYELGRDIDRFCRKLVHEQHLQQQGWAALMANLEDIMEEYHDRTARFDVFFEEFLRNKPKNAEYLQKFEDDLEMLNKINILPALMANASDTPFTAFDEVYSDMSLSYHKKNPADRGDEGNVNSRSQESSQDEQKTKIAFTLLNWISARENQKSLMEIADHCKRGLNLISDNQIETLRLEVLRVKNKMSQRGSIDFSALSARLCALEEVMVTSKNIVTVQQEYAQGFQQNHSRATATKDTTVLPDLCESHARQLEDMLRNHSRLLDIRDKIVKAKRELLAEINGKLGNVIFLENAMTRTDSQLMFLHRTLWRLQRHFYIIEQIHDAPSLYVAAVNEVVRRKKFSQAFLAWSTELASHLLNIHNEEVTKRREFSAMFEGHFLNALFPGLEDLPPSFATKAPTIFDSKLPNLCESDWEDVRDQFPELAVGGVPDISDVVQFFTSRSGKSDALEDGKDAALGTVLEIEAASQEASSLSHLTHQHHLKDFEKGFESETDTEEFEKVGQSPIDRPSSRKNASTSPDLTQFTTEISTSTEENLGSTRVEVERLRNIIKDFTLLSNGPLEMLKNDLQIFKESTVDGRNLFKQEIEHISKTLVEINQVSEISKREEVQKLTVDHELEMNDVKKLISNKEEDNQILRNVIKEQEMQTRLQKDKTKLESAALAQQIEDLKATNLTLEERMLNFEEIKDKAVKEAQCQLIHGHKTEIETLRCRYRLMTLTNMERSPSDTSLEKIDRQDMIDLHNHESIMNQVQNNFVLEKENAIKAAVEEEKKHWEKKLFEEVSKVKIENEVTLKELNEEHARQLSALKLREDSFKEECENYRQTIQNLTSDHVGNDEDGTMWPLDQIEYLHSENERLKGELVKQLPNAKQTPSLMDLYFNYDLRLPIGGPVGTSSCSAPTTSSIATQRTVTYRDAATSPEPIIPRKHLTESQDSLVLSGQINIKSCAIGEKVLVIWDSKYSNYVILQESSSLYFLHSDCMSTLTLRPVVDGMPRKMYVIGEVVDKEYCHAKKNENRFNVPKGTKFYRVTCRLPPSHRHESQSREIASSSLLDAPGPSISTPAKSGAAAKLATSESGATTPTDRIRRHNKRADSRSSIETGILAPPSDSAERASSSRLNPHPHPSSIVLTLPHDVLLYPSSPRSTDSQIEAVLNDPKADDGDKHSLTSTYYDADDLSKDRDSLAPSEPETGSETGRGTEKRSEIDCESE